MGVKFSQLPIASSVASDDYLAVLDTSERALKRTTINHASTTDAFGLGTDTTYGHNKIIDDLSKSTFTSGESLSAHQGNILANLIAFTETSPSAAAYETGDYLVFDNNLWKVTSDISVGDNLVEGTNIEKTTVMGEVKYSIGPEPVHIYGVEWDGTSTTRWTRTDESASFVDPIPAVNNGTGSSPFDNCSPWKNIKRKTSVKSGEVVYIPKFWVKITKTGSTMKIQIATGETEGFVPAPAFQDRGDGRGELDYILVGRYHCASDFKSKTGVLPHANITRSAFRTGIHNLGTNTYQWDYAVRLTLYYLYLVEYADWNSQKTIGFGCGNGSNTQNVGATDAMQYHTGTAAATREYGVGKGAVQYRYIEGLWDNVFDWVDGIYYSVGDVCIVKNPENFSDTSNGTKIGTVMTSGGFITAFFVGTGEYAAFIYPSVGHGIDTVYVCDYCRDSDSGVVLYAGGDYTSDGSWGLFYLNGSKDASYANVSVGSRLMELPNIL